MRVTVAIWHARRENQICRCPRRSWATSRGTIQRTCFLCANAGIIVRSYEDRPIGRLIESQVSGGHFKSVHLRPKVTVESGDIQEALRLHQDAHKACFIANSVNFPVLLEPAIQHTSTA